MDACNENVFEFLRNQEICTCTLVQGRFISKVRKLAEEKPDECQIVTENKDGSIVAHFPVKWLKIRPPMDISEERRKEMAERFARNVLDVE